MEAVCPRCLYSFFPFPPKVSDIPKDAVYAHECKTGFIRPYPQFICSDCKPFNEDTVLISLERITEINRQRKFAKFREKEEEDRFAIELAESLPEGIPIE